MDGEMPNKDRPYLIVAVGQNSIQTIDVSTIKNKEWKAGSYHNHILNSYNPPFLKPSFVKIDSLQTVELSKCSNMRLLCGGARLDSIELKTIRSKLGFQYIKLSPAGLSDRGFIYAILVRCSLPFIPTVITMKLFAGLSNYVFLLLEVSHLLSYQCGKREPYQENLSIFGTVNPEWARTNRSLNADTIAYAEVWNYESQKEELIQFTSVSDFFSWINNPPVAFRCI